MLRTAAPPAPCLVRTRLSTGVSATSLALAGLSVLALVLRVVPMQDRGVWLDETYSLYWASFPWQAIPGLLLRYEAHPPLYYLLLHLWLPYTGTDTWLRFPSAVFGAATVPVVYGLGLSLVGRGPSLLGAALFAVTPTQVWYGQEARPYALLSLLIGLTLLAFLRLRERPTRGLALGYCLALVAALWLHYAAMLALAGLVLATLVPGGRPGWRRYWLAGTVAAGALFLPWAIAVLLAQWSRLPSAYTESYVAAAPGLLAMRRPPLLLLGAGVPSWWPPFHRPEWLLPLLVAVPGVGWWSLRRGDRWLTLGWTGGTLAVGFLLAQRYPVFFQPKIFLPLGLVAALLTAAGLLHLWYRRRAVGLAASLFVAAVTASGLATVYFGAPDGLHTEDWGSTARYVQERASPDDLLLFLPPGRALPFERAYGHAAPQFEAHGVPMDLAPAGQAGALERFVRPADLERLGALLSGHRVAWLVTMASVRDGPQLNMPLVFSYLDGRAVRTERVDFTGIAVYRYDLGP